MAPRAGLEPATIRLTVECSTAELPRNTAESALGPRITKAPRLAKRKVWRASDRGTWPGCVGDDGLEGIRIEAIVPQARSYNLRIIALEIGGRLFQRNLAHVRRIGPAPSRNRRDGRPSGNAAPRKSPLRWRRWRSRAWDRRPAASFRFEVSGVNI